MVGTLHYEPRKEIAMKHINKIKRKPCEHQRTEPSENKLGDDIFENFTSYVWKRYGLPQIQYNNDLPS